MIAFDVAIRGSVMADRCGRVLSTEAVPADLFVGALEPEGVGLPIPRGATYSVSMLEQKVAAILRVPAPSVLLLEVAAGTPAPRLHAVVENAEDLPLLDAGQCAALRRPDLAIDAVTYARGFALPRTSWGKKRHDGCARLLANGFLPVVCTMQYVGGEGGWELLW
jgi:hypothetical protein